MNSLDRAKRFLASQSAKLALTAVPLAIAVPAAFGQNGISVIDSFGTGNTCSVILQGGTTTCGVESQSTQGGNSAFNEVDIFSNGAIVGSNGSATLFTSGSASGVIPNGTLFPVSWDFIISQPPTELPAGTVQSNTAAIDVTLTWSIFSNLGTSTATETLTNPGTGTYTGSASLDVNPSGGSSVSLTGYSIEMQVTGLPSGFSVSVPQGASIDLNSPTATPEPGTFVLGGLGMLGLFHRFHRRRKI